MLEDAEVRKAITQILTEDIRRELEQKRHNPFHMVIVGKRVDGLYGVSSDLRTRTSTGRNFRILSVSPKI